MVVFAHLLGCADDAVDGVAPGVRVESDGEGLRCVVDQPATDGKGRALRTVKTWTVDGAPGGDPSMAAPGELWTCHAHGVDADGDAGPEGFASGTVRPPNVVIFLADDVGTDMVGVYDEHPEPANTPNIDALAADGVLFRNAYTHDLCSPTRAALQTGLYGNRFGIGHYMKLNDPVELPTDAWSIPQMLHDSPHRWATSAVGKWHIANRWGAAEDHPNELGWDYFAGAIGNPDQALTRDDTLVSERDYYHWEKITNGAIAWSDTYMTIDTWQEAEARMEAMPEPWVLYVAFNAPHGPFQTPPSHLYTRELPDRPTQRERYLAMLEGVDTAVGGIVAAAPSNTTFVFLGDNGSPGQVVAEPRRSDQAKYTLYEGGTNVPFIASGALVSGRGESEALVHVVDILPTLAAMASVPVVDRDLDGLSFLPYLAEPELPSTRSTLLTTSFGPNGPAPYEFEEWAIRGPRYKLLRRHGRDRFHDLQSGFMDGPELGATTDKAEQAARRQLRAELNALIPTLYD